MPRYNLLPTAESVSHFASRGLPKRTSFLLTLGGGIIALFLIYSLGTRYSSYNGLHRPQSYATSSSEVLATCIANTANLDSLRTKWKWEQCLRPGSKPEYYLSVVLVTRNDDYAGGQHHRVQNHIDSTWLLAEKTKEKIELIIVEWNPPTDKRRIIDAYRFRHSDYLVYRIITVPPSLHDIMYNRGNSPLHEFEGKNLGMRFARGEFVVCTNQDDIWSHLFFNAVKSRSFENRTIYLQHQDFHNIHDNLPPSIVKVPAFADDEILFKACLPRDEEWGSYRPPEPIELAIENALKIGDQAGDFTMAHRDTWKAVRGYRETGGVAWVDIEFIATAHWEFGMRIVHIGDTFSCHQDHPNIWESFPERMTNNSEFLWEDLIYHRKSYANPEGKWAMLHMDIWELGLQCVEFGGGLCI